MHAAVEEQANGMDNDITRSWHNRCRDTFIKECRDVKGLIVDGGGALVGGGVYGWE